MERKKIGIIGIIGFGNMGSAIAERIKSQYQVFVFDKDKNKTNNLSDIKVAHGSADLVNKVDLVILAVKPQDLDGVLSEIKSVIKDRMIISIAAGIPISYLKRYLGDVYVVRAMPNLPIKVGKGVICVAKETVRSEDFIFIAAFYFSNLGEVFFIKEEMMDAATAVSGSGPGFFFALVEDIAPDKWEQFALEVFSPRLAAAAQAVGFDKIEGDDLAYFTALGSLRLLQKSGLSAAELRQQVASKGGTTEAGLEVLHRGGSLEEAIKAALARAEELSKKE